jgi:hypothetical protein
VSSACAALFRYTRPPIAHEEPEAKISQLSMSHQLLPKEEWTKPEEVRQTTIL